MCTYIDTDEQHTTAFIHYSTFSGCGDASNLYTPSMCTTTVLLISSIHTKQVPHLALFTGQVEYSFEYKYSN